MSTQEQAILEFERYFGHPPSFVVRAPGRVNLIGEHTDYNDGFVLPIAIDRAVWIALRPPATQQVILHSLDLKRSAEFSPENIKYENQEWVEYIKGIARALQQAGYLLEGWEGLIASDIPVGAGLSSSAALELSAARAFAAVSSFPWEAIKMAKIRQQAERDWVGVNCGIMDQMVDCAQQESACYSARLTGAGFGGCAIALVHSNAVQNFTETVAINYQTATGLQPEIYVCTATDGATITSI